MKKPKATIIIPTLNRKEELFNTLGSLKGQSIQNFEILIIDQNENPLDLERASLKQKINHIQIDKKSLPNARNIGAKEAKSDILIYIDDDIEIASSKFIEAHLQNYQNDKIGLVVGRTIQPNEKKENPVQKVGKITKNLLIIGGSFNSTKKQYTSGIIGCNFSCRKQVWKKIGGFDLNFVGTANMEESDFALRARKKGWKIIFEPEAVLKHLSKPSGGVRSNTQETIKKRYWIFNNYVYLFKKHGNTYLWPVFLLYLLLRGIFYSIKNKNLKIIFSACIRGTFDGLRRIQA